MIEIETALNTGALKYVGKPCRHGHDGLRYARSNECVRCVHARNHVSPRQRREARAQREREILAMVVAADAKRARQEARQAREREARARRDLLLLIAAAAV